MIDISLPMRIQDEMPQVFLMRVAMGLSVDEKDKNDKAESFINYFQVLTI